MYAHDLSAASSRPASHPMSPRRLPFSPRQAKHTLQYVGGFLASSDHPPPPPGGVTLKAMVAEDVAECADLFLAAHGRDCGWDRRADITGMLGAGMPFAM